jgi:hypothetical protein
MDLVSFADQPPNLEVLAARVAARSGLSVQTEPLGLEEGRYRVHGRVSFASLPKVSVEVSCDSPEWQRQRKRREVESLVESGVLSPKRLQALEGPPRPGCQVWVKGSGSTDPTLFWYTVLALEDLGGTVTDGTDKPLSDRVRRFYDDLRRQYSEPVAEADLLRRVRAADWSEFWKLCLALPILLPMLVLLWTVLGPVIGVLFLQSLLRKGAERPKGHRKR